MTTTRRNFLIGLGAASIAIATPAIIRTPGLLMPVRKVTPVERLEPGWYVGYSDDQKSWDWKPAAFPNGFVEFPWPRSKRYVQLQYMLA